MTNLHHAESGRKRWIRLHRESINNPKIGRLSDHQHRAWHNCLLVANDDGLLPSIADIAFHLRMTNAAAEQVVCELIEAGLIDVDATSGPRTLRMHDWSAHQYISDTSIERVKRYRQKRKDAGLAPLGDYSKFKPTLIKRDGEQCVYCKSTEKLVVDHMVPIQLGGTDDTDNLALACKRCNSGKAGRTPKQAGFNFAIKSAENALSRYQSLDVTVTVTPPESESESDTDLVLLPSEQVAPRERDERRIDFGFVKGMDRRSEAIDKLKLRAEGLGLPVDEMLETINRNKARNRPAYFTTLCVNRLSELAPGVSEADLRNAMWGYGDAYAKLCQAMLEGG